jgi:signal transduction histidine kinase
LDPAPEASFDELAALAARVCGTPFAALAFVARDRIWCKTGLGLAIGEMPLAVSFCAEVAHTAQPFVVEDALAAPRFAANPWVTGPSSVRFYAGVPVLAPDGACLAVLSVADRLPRRFEAEDRDLLGALARVAAERIELCRRRREGSLEELQRANAELREFAATVAHDLKEPLRNLAALGELLAADLGPDLPQSAEEDLRGIAEGTRRMEALIADLLDHSRVERVELDSEAFPLIDCVDLALDALSSTLHETGAFVAVDELPNVRGDRTLLTQLFQNLLGNAMKFVEGGIPQIRVTFGFEDGRPVVGVRDNGIGIAAGEQEAVFTPFHRLNARARFDGTGMGLAICKRVVERHGGRIWIESGLGRGSHVKFTLAGLEALQQARRRRA